MNIKNMKEQGRRVIEKLPDALTLSRGIISIILLLFIPFSYINSIIFVVLYIIAWYTDVLDGKIARKLEIEGRLAEWDYYFDTLLQFTIITYGTFIGSLNLLFFLLWCLAWAIFSIATRNKAVVNLMGVLGVIIQLFFMYFYDEILFWILVAFWLFVFFTGLPRFVARWREFARDWSKLRKKNRN